MEVLLWNWPAADESAWQALVGGAMTHADYQTLLASVQADQERQGQAVRRVTLTVSAMRAALTKHNLQNTPDGRAAALALEASNG